MKKRLTTKCGIYFVAFGLLCLSIGCANQTDIEPENAIQKEQGSRDLQQGNESTAMVYCLYVDVAEGGWKSRYDDDTRIFLGGRYCGGGLTIFINGSPRKVFSHGGIFLRSDAWLQEGNNEVTFDGDHLKPVIVKVVALKEIPRLSPDTESIAVEATICKTIVESASKSALKFVVSSLRGGNTFFDLLPESDAEREEAEVEIKSLVRKFYDAMADHDTARVAKLMSRRQEIKQLRPLFDFEADVAVVNQIRQVAADESFNLAGKPEELKLVWGRRNVILYSGIEAGTGMPGPQGAYSFRFRTDSIGRSLWSPFILVRIKGEWIFI